LRCGLFVALAAAGNASAADLKIGYIDSARIFQEYKDAQEAQARFDRQAQGWRDEATEKERAVKQLRDEVRDMSPILSSLKRQEKEEALDLVFDSSSGFLIYADKTLDLTSEVVRQLNERSTSGSNR